jgi:hypothetical protein
MICALIGFVAARVFLGGAAQRLTARGESDRMIVALGDLGAIAIAALAVLVPPVAYLVLAFGIWVLLVRRRRAGQKYEGLRILR